MNAHEPSTFTTCIDNCNNCNDIGNKNISANATNNTENNQSLVHSINVTVTGHDDVADKRNGINSYTNACSFLTEHNPYYAILHGMNGYQVQFLVSMLPYEVQQAYDENVRILYNSSKKLD